MGPAALGKGGGGRAPSITLCEAQLPSDLHPSLSTSGSAAARDLGQLPGTFPLPLLPNREGPGGQGGAGLSQSKAASIPSRCPYCSRRSLGAFHTQPAAEKGARPALPTYPYFLLRGCA